MMNYKKYLLIMVFLLILLVFNSNAFSTNVIVNGSFDNNLNAWNNLSSGDGNTIWDDSVGGISIGSAQGRTLTGQNQQMLSVLSQNINTINATDIVSLSLYWYKYNQAALAVRNNMIIRLMKPSGDSVDIWSNNNIPGINSSISGNVDNLLVSPFFDQTGVYAIKLIGDLQCGNDTNAYAQNNFDDVVIDVQPFNSNTPQLTAGVTAVSPTSLDRSGTVTTSISTLFTDLDDPGISSFFITFKLRAPFSQSVFTVADLLQNGQNGLSIINNGGGSYTATIDWDPPDDAVLGTYDLYAEVFDGEFYGFDYFDNNLEELTISGGGENSLPMITSGATYANPVFLERIGANNTTISASFYDADATGINTFTVTFKVRHPDDIAETILADNAGNGINGVTITDDGGGNYTTSISWDPLDTEPQGFYDLYFHVFDGFDTAFDIYSNNIDELELYDAISNNVPSLVAGNTFVLPDTVNRIGAEFTMIKGSFSDADIPGYGTFSITIKVQDATSTEYTLVNAANHGQQGLRVEHSGGANYTAAVLWDPNVAQPTGPYDIYFEVQDEFSGTAIDNYSSNNNELEVVSEAILGDGYLLHRTNDASSCGGPNSACHNMLDHQGNDCLTCHTPHGTANIYLVKDTVQTPNSGLKEVIFKTLGIGDPYNNPDPTVGDPTSGVMADDQDGVFTGVCEVCHTSTSHHRNDGSHPPPVHNNAQICSDCHAHAEGFAVGESGGGIGCTCHQPIFDNMDSVSVAHRHILANIDADYSPGASGMYTIKNCLTCHVDHDIFRPDLNTGIGQRGKNLRIDWATDPIQGDNSVLTNSDYSQAGNGGICLSCHSGPSCQGCHSAHKSALSKMPESTSALAFSHTFIPKSDFDGATSTHNYDIPITFSKDGSVFNSNCSKCHNDNMTKDFQNSIHMVSTHGSDYENIIAPLGIPAPGSPLEEEFCYECHSTTSNPNAGSNLDYYGVKAMGNSGTLEIESDMGLASAHPVNLFSGIHVLGENPSTMTRHVECADCHNPHAATSADPPLPALNGALVGVSGIDINGAAVNPASNSYEICFKCHGDQNSGVPFIDRDDGSTNTRLEFHPNSLSFHPVTAVGKNPSVPSLYGSWNENSIMTCMDCHASSGNGSSGPHGSDYSPILRLNYETGDNLTENAARYALCYDCHDRNIILNGNDSWDRHDKHINGEDTPCSVCHDPHGVASVGVGGGEHLISFDLSVVSGSMMGRIEFLDSGDNKPTCWLTCHGKNHKGWN